MEPSITKTIVMLTLKGGLQHEEQALLCLLSPAAMESQCRLGEQNEKQDLQLRESNHEPVHNAVFSLVRPKIFDCSRPEWG